MSTRIKGTLQVSRSNRTLASLAAVTLDPRRLAAWLKAGHAGAIEARRLLVAANEEHVRRLRDALGGERAYDLVAPGSLAEGALLSPLDDQLIVGGDELGPLSDALVLESLESESVVLLSAFSASLAAEGFAVDEIRAAEDGVIVAARRGDQLASIRVDPERQITVEVDVPGFRSTEECEATHSAVVHRLADLGITVGTPLSARERKLAADVEQAVRASLPSYRIRSIIEGDELQVIALPPSENEGSSR